MPTIQIVTHPRQRLSDWSLAASLARHWRGWGHEVTVGPVHSIASDVALLHVDLTHVPARLSPANPLGRPLLNGGVNDISKRRFSEALIRPGDPWAGPVIVKSDLNVNGKPERELRPAVQRAAFRALERAGLRQRMESYQVFDRAAEVPASLWSRRDLIVERFTPEIEGGLYSLRMWIFFGDQGYYERRFSPHPLVKAGNSVRTEYLDRPVPEKLQRLRREMGFDFGKFDFVLWRGEPIILDVNKTPAVGFEDNERQRLLARGILPYLQKP